MTEKFKFTQPENTPEQSGEGETLPAEGTQEAKPATGETPEKPFVIDYNNDERVPPEESFWATGGTDCFGLEASQEESEEERKKREENDENLRKYFRTLPDKVTENVQSPMSKNTNGINFNFKIDYKKDERVSDYNLPGNNFDFSEEAMKAQDRQGELLRALLHEQKAKQEPETKSLIHKIRKDLFSEFFDES